MSTSKRRGASQRKRIDAIAEWALSRAEDMQKNDNHHGVMRALNIFREAVRCRDDLVPEERADADRLMTIIVPDIIPRDQFRAMLDAWMIDTLEKVASNAGV